jgi:hypothetical protein
MYTQTNKAIFCRAWDLNPRDSENYRFVATRIVVSRMFAYAAKGRDHSLFSWVPSRCENWIWLERMGVHLSTRKVHLRAILTRFPPMKPAEFVGWRWREYCPGRPLCPLDDAGSVTAVKIEDRLVSLRNTSIEHFSESSVHTKFGSGWQLEICAGRRTQIEG